ncbi:cytochrome c-550 PedF [Aliiroseovarius sp. PTFE2010]|uniref:cytochrome c-550 PedF n=1 Tax=Aliiroseovarius sp. PTFE2010 TaxID=3417190 RepID=UPI003CEBC98C
MTSQRIHRAGLALAFVSSATLAFAHGDVAPQPVNTEALPDIGEEWLIENPYRDMGDQVYQEAINIGASGYNQNCARCHGLEVISGGLAPDLRFLEAEEYGDEWYMERFIHGYTQNGTTKMPAFGDLLGQKAGWAIRTYIETRPDSDMVSEYSDELKAIRDQLQAWADDASGADVAGTASKLEEIGNQIETLSGAPVADSIALRAAHQLQADPTALSQAVETLTVGLSVAH